MLGLGEELDEVREVIAQLAELRVDILTLGQYLQPSKRHMPIARYVSPEEFSELADFATECGIGRTLAGPLVRSSYHADGQAQMIRDIRRRRQQT